MYNELDWNFLFISGILCLLSIYVYQLMFSSWHYLNMVMVLLAMSLAILWVGINQIRQEMKREFKQWQARGRASISDTTTMVGLEQE